MTSPALEQLAGRVQSAARVVARAPSSIRDDALRLAADLLEEEWATLVEANRADLERAEAAGMVEAARDRLRLTEGRVRGMAVGLRKVAALSDPVGEVTEGWVRPNGLRVTRVRVPLGVAAAYPRVVGKEQVMRGRAMHWIRIDTYFKGDLDNPEMYYEPLPCMQCENAPCE